MKQRLLAVLFALSTVAFAQIYTNLDQTTCSNGACAGWSIDNQNAGGQGGTGTLEEITTAPNGHALKATLTGTVGWSNVLFFAPQTSTNANYFYGEEIAYVQSLAGVQALEFDMYAFNNPYRFMFGSQCVIGGDWWGWNDNAELSGTGPGWQDLHIPCVWSLNTWHSIKWWAHRDPLTVTNCPGFHTLNKTPGNFPCSYQDVLEFDGVRYNINLATPASDIPIGWSNASGIQFQLDQTAIGQTIQMGVANINFTATGQ